MNTDLSSPSVAPPSAASERLAPPTPAEDRELSRFNTRKRLLDLLILVASAPLTVPVGLLVAVLVRLGIGRPVLFVQPRLGLGGSVFPIYKFRSMTSATDGQGRLLPDAERLTTAGRLLRRSSLDELPQLLNIARGDMSLIGPRPLFPRYRDFYTPSEQLRHWVRPGVTGLAQVEGRNNLAWDDRLRLDSSYVLRHRVRDDVRLVLHTIRKVLTGADVAVVASVTGAPLDVARARNLRLRELREQDLPRRVDWMNDPGIRHHMQIGEVTAASTQAWFTAISTNPRRHDFVCCRGTDGEPLAMVGLNEDGAQGEALLYVFVGPEFQGRGIGSEATGLACEWAFYERGLSAVTLTVATENRAAVRTYEKLGFETVEAESSESRRAMRLERSAYERDVR